MNQRVFRAVIFALLLVLLAATAAVLVLRNLGAILSALLPSDGGDMDFGRIFAQTKDAAITPHLLLPLILSAPLVWLFAKRPLAQRACWLRVLVGIAILLVCLLGAFVSALLLTRVNDIRFCDLLAALLPILGAL